MNKQKRYRYISIFTIIAIFAGAAVYAWFPIGVNVQGFVAKTGSIETDVKVYSLRDFNLDGLTDTDDNGNSVSTLITNGINITSMNPGEVYTYKIDITDTGTMGGVLSLTLSGITGDLSDVLSVHVVSPVDGGTIYLKGQSSANLCSNISLAAGEKKSVIFTVKFATISELTANNISYNNSLDGLNYYSNKTFGISTIRVNLTQAVQTTQQALITSGGGVVYLL